MILVYLVDTFFKTRIRAPETMATSSAIAKTKKKFFVFATCTPAAANCLPFRSSGDKLVFSSVSGLSV
ncbi:MAG: hypothetical protein A3F15_00780 [Candidatus Wildermuthbacteria bacterium RIFCSPHIGHO2_12_FULL_40_12]|uniref:Uncharacterized protein n=1 Tax=Candidatus Wildermuthbacteria bacterium RIFCSPHIGHO2_12_FULL_40_12 TaxID=1802457 RepID=A0A1G2RB25_9BACT|nr:MAG: hypothetical protein A3F15_00780 [Candidatus Wildermuthbacteria bacterium RIFCSPHIGHO2_12_FULL_40_12]